MRKQIGLLVVAAALLVATAAVAANTQVGSSLKATGDTGYIAGRSDGVFQGVFTGSPYAIENGQPTMTLGAGYRETFAYGAAKGITQLDQSGGGACAANTTTVPCIATFGGGVKLAWFPIVTATLELAQVATGLDIAGDLVDNDGNELAGGVLGASGRPFVVGVDPAFYFCATAKITDVSGSDEFQWGFRSTEPFNAVFSSYKDIATIGSVSGAIKTTTNLANAGDVVTDTTSTWADLATKTLCVGVGATGAVSYSINGSAPTTVGYTFASGKPVIPFMHERHDSDIAESTILSLWQVGYCLNDNAPANAIGATYVAKTVCDAVQ